MSLGGCGDGTTDPPPPPPVGNIAGTVSVEGSTPLAGITVSLNGPVTQVTQTDAAGTFRFDSVPEGSYTLTVSGEGDDVTFEVSTQSVSVATGQTSSVVFTAVRVRNAIVNGTVRLDGVGEAGREVLLDGPEGSQNTVTDAGGQYRFEGLLPGTYSVSLGGLDNTVTFESTTGQVTVGLSETGTLDFSGIREVFATAQLVAIEDADRGTRLSFDAIRGEVEAFLRVESGTRTLTHIRIRLDGEIVSELDVSGTALSGAQTVSSLTDFRLPFDTGEYDETTGQPRFMNGAKVLVVELETVRDGAFEAASADIVLRNEHQIGGLVFVTGLTDPGVVSGSRRWYGNQDLEFRVIPVIYSPDVEVGAVRVQASISGSNSRSPLDFGSGPGQSHATGADLRFTATVANNAGLVQDDPLGSGQTIRVTAILDSEGADITSQFLNLATLQGLFFDYLGPEATVTSVILFDGGLIPPNQWLSAGAFAVRDVVEEGVGGLELELEATFGGAVVESGIDSVDDLSEGARDYRVRVSVLRDALGNLGDASTIPVSQAFGVDRTPPSITNFLPAVDLVINPDDDGMNGVQNNQVSFTVVDPALADGTGGSGFTTSTFTGIDNETQIPYDLTGQISPNTAGSNSINLLFLPDASFDMVLEVFDDAIPANRAARGSEFTVDNSPPAVDIVDPPPGFIQSNNSVVGFTFEGSATDPSGLGLVQISIRDADSDGNGLCDETDTLYPQGNGAGQVNINSLTVTSTATEGWDEIFSFRNDGASGQQIACFFVEATDLAKNTSGGSEPNRTVRFNRTVLDWL